MPNSVLKLVFADGFVADLSLLKSKSSEIARKLLPTKNVLKNSSPDTEL